jgi:hypothetical protein
MTIARSPRAVRVKQQIKSIAQQPGVEVKSVVLIGHVPQPMSRDSNIPPDGHSGNSNGGAWVADAYYGDLVDDHMWTDAGSLSPTHTRFAMQNNVTGDGKFDQEEIGSAVEAAVGRIDFNRMVNFAQAEMGLDLTQSTQQQLATLRLMEVQLLKAYLNKDHAWRVGAVSVEKRAIVDDNWGHTGYGFATLGWRFAANVGASNVTSADYDSLASPGQSALFAYGGGGGGLTIALPGTQTNEPWPVFMYDPDERMSGFPSSAVFAGPLNNLNAVFNFAMGSFAGNWWRPNSLLRSLMADPYSVALTAAWSDWPRWHLHEMATGAMIGESLLTTQNNSTTYSPGGSGTHSSLLGDPTLRQANVKPASNLTIRTTQTGVGANLSMVTKVEWTASADAAVSGYHIYRSDNPDGPYTLLNASAVSATTYTDTSAPTNGTPYYMVRATKLESTPSGTYWNLSTGTFSRRLTQSGNFEWNEPQQKIQFNFVQNVSSGLSVSNFTISGEKWNSTAQSFQAVSLVAGTDYEMESYNTSDNTVKIRFLTTSEFGVANTIWSGRYTITVNPLQANSTIGQSLKSIHEYKFVFAGGDTNNDGIVDFTDLLVITQNYGQTGVTGNSFGLGDFNNDGVIDFSDYLILAQNYNLDVNP